MRLNTPNERRADRRHALTGHACVVRLSTAGPEVFGGIVDVGARGVRLRVRPGFLLETGDVCHVQLVVALAGSTNGPPVRLHGRAVLLRRVETTDLSEEIALRFEEPLQVGEAFATQPPPANIPREPTGLAFQAC